VGDIIDGIEYRWANETDIPAVARCTDDAYREFTVFYMDPALYQPESPERVLIAVHGDQVCGTLIVGRESEGAGVGSVGCTAVATAWRERHIAANMVLLGSRHLREAGMDEGFLGYTYSGLDRLYGIAGYKICLYYAMAKKELGA
jgi:predicted N-acetyltransferase YhbS